MFSRTLPPILPPSEIPKRKSPATIQAELEGVQPNLPEPGQQPGGYVDAHIEEIAVELMREQIPSSATSAPTGPGHPHQAPASSSPASTSDTFPHTPTFAPARPSSAQTMEMEHQRQQTTTPPLPFSSRSSVPTGDPTAHADKALAATRLEEDLDGHGIAKGLMRQPEGKGDQDTEHEEEQRREGGYSDNGNAWKRGKGYDDASFD